MAFFAAPSAPRMGTISLPSVMSTSWRTTDDDYTYVDAPPPGQNQWLNSPRSVDEATRNDALALFLEPPTEIGLPPPGQPSRPVLEQRFAVNTPQPVSTGPAPHGRHFHEEDTPFLERLNNHRGDAQASPPHEWNTHDRPINVAVEQVQEAGPPTRLTALETVRAFHATIIQREQLSAPREEAEGRVAALAFFNLLHVFRRNPYANIQEALEVFDIVTTLIHEHVMQSLDLVGAAWLLFVGGNIDGCRLLIPLTFGDTNIDLTEGDIRILVDLASYL